MSSPLPPISTTYEVLSGTTLNFATVVNGGTLIVDLGGTARFISISSGGVENDYGLAQALPSSTAAF